MSIDFQHDARMRKLKKLYEHADAPMSSALLATFTSEQRVLFANEADANPPSEITWAALVDGRSRMEKSQRVQAAAALPADPFEGLL